MIKLEPQISSVGQTFAQGLRVGYTPTIDPGPFVRAYDSTIRAGQQLQNLGEQGVNVALKEQEVYNTTQINSTNATRKVLYSELKTQLLQPENFDAHKYEQNLSNGLLGINKVLEKPNKKQIYNPYLKGLIQAEGSAFYASQISSIQKEARVFRVKALKAQGLENIRLLRQEELKMPDIPSNQLLRQGIDATMMQLVDDMVAGGLLDPDDGVKEKTKIFKDREDAKIRKVVDNAIRMSDVYKVLDTAQYQSAEEREISLIRAKDNIRTNRTHKIAEETRIRKQQDREHKALQNTTEGDFDARIFDPKQFSTVTMKELRDARDDNLITRVYFDSRVNMIQKGDPYADRPTDSDEYDKVEKLVEQQLKYPDRPIIKNSEIYSNDNLSNEARNILSGRLRGRGGTLTDNKTTKARKKVKEALLIDAYTKMGKVARVKKKRDKLVEFDRRVTAGEDPDEVAEEMINAEIDINKNPLSKVSQIDTDERLKEIPQSIRRVVKSPDGVVVPNIREMLKQADAGLKSKLIDDDEYKATIDALEELHLKWPADMIEKHGGIKSSKTIKREKLEKEKKAKEDEEKRLQKIEEDNRLKAKEAAQLEREKFFQEAGESIANLPSKAGETIRSTAESVGKTATELTETGLKETKDARQQLQEAARNTTQIVQEVINTIKESPTVPEALNSFMDDLILDFPELTNIKDAWNDVPNEYRDLVSEIVMNEVEAEGVVGGGQDIVALINTVVAEEDNLKNKGLKKKSSDKSGMYPGPKKKKKKIIKEEMQPPLYSLDISDMNLDEINQEIARLNYAIQQGETHGASKIYKERLLARKKELE
tara:strand:+ start:184 stop:2655 length:2472 start_codon:yes stop_codon:yes gene_type:complete